MSHRADSPDMPQASPRRLVFLALLALVPVGLFTASRSAVVWLSVACVLLLVASLYLLFGPAEGAASHAP